MDVSQFLTPQMTKTTPSLIKTPKTRAIKTKGSKITRPTVNDDMKKFCNTMALLFKVPTPVFLTVISDIEAHISDKWGNEVFAVKRCDDGVYDFVLFDRNQGKCTHNHPLSPSKLRTKAQRKAVSAGIWSCRNPGHITDARLVESKIVCRQFQLWDGYDCIRDYFDYADDEEEREGSLHEMVTKPLHCKKQKDCKTLFCEKEDH
jgi:hypothetical protein